MPSKEGYDWTDLNLPPVLEDHSIVKHEIIGRYLNRYIDVVTSNPRVNPLRINLVDGFAGGGRYRKAGSQSIVDGSPLVLIKAVEEAEARINTIRNKPFKINARYYFSEIDQDACRQLEFALGEHGYSTGSELPTVFTISKSFI